MDKQTQRAARFGTSAPAKGVAIAQVPEAELARKRRAEKFGLKYEEPDQDGVAYIPGIAAQSVNAHLHCDASPSIRAPSGCTSCPVLGVPTPRLDSRHFLNLPCCSKRATGLGSLSAPSACKWQLVSRNSSCCMSQLHATERRLHPGIDKRIVLEKRQDTDGHSQPRPDTIHLYGVDLLTTHDILSHFSAYNPTYVEWINDSSCNVCFPDEFAVKRVIVQMGEALTAQETADSGGMHQLARS